MLADELDLVVHVGDYIYESTWGSEPVRSHGAAEPYTLDDYRARHALYKTDPDLQAAHAAAPWLVTWDDHEVDNDYANARSEELDPPELFLLRRAAAYQAYYEHMPLPRRAVAMGRRAALRALASAGSRASTCSTIASTAIRRPARGPAAAAPTWSADCASASIPRGRCSAASRRRWLRAGLAARARAGT